MAQAEGILFIVGIAAVLGGLIWWAYYRKKQRRQALAAVAAKLGLDYSPHDPYGLDGFPFSLFGRGDGRGCENVIQGTWQGIGVKAFDYWYYDQSTSSKGGTSRTYHYFSCAEADVAIVAPHLVVTHETVFSRLADHVGFADIQFESEDFNRMFRVKCDDPKFATDLVDARMMQWLLLTKGAWSFELLDNSVLWYSNRLRPNAVPLLLAALRQFLQHVPRVAYELYGTREDRVESSDERTTT